MVTNPATKLEYRDSAHGLLTADGIGATVVRDCPAFVCQRVLATICNIGCQIAQLGTAEPDDIDKAVVLGLNYPSGPLTFGETLGSKMFYGFLKDSMLLMGTLVTAQARGCAAGHYWVCRYLRPKFKTAN